MTSPAICVDGVPVPDGAATLVPLDDGLVRGDGVFEGMRQYDRRVRTLDAHLDRLERSARVIDLPMDRALVRTEVEAFSRLTGAADCAIRLILTRGGRRILREEPIPAVDGVPLTLFPVRHRVTPLLEGSKTLSYAANMQAASLARAAGCDDALFVRADDDAVLEGPTFAFCWLEGDTVVFPPLPAGVLDSLTRRLVVEALPTRERVMPVGDLSAADGALIVSTVQEARPVRTVAGVVEFDPDAAAVRRVCAALAEITRARLG